MPISSDQIEKVDAQLEDGVRIFHSSAVLVPQTNGALPIEVRPGYHDGDLKLMLHGSDGVARLVEVTADDLRVAIDMAETLRS